MVAIVLTIKRKQGMTFDEYDSYWRNHHAPLITSIPEFMRHCRKYSQFHILAPSGDGSLREFETAPGKELDGVTILWFDSQEDLRKAFNEPRYLEVVKPDEYEFNDLDNCVGYVTEEVVMWNGGELYNLPRIEAGEPVVRPFADDSVPSSASSK